MTSRLDRMGVRHNEVCRWLLLCLLVMVARQSIAQPAMDDLTIMVGHKGQQTGVQDVVQQMAGVVGGKIPSKFLGLFGKSSASFASCAVSMLGIWPSCTIVNGDIGGAAAQYIVGFGMTVYAGEPGRHLCCRRQLCEPSPQKPAYAVELDTVRELNVSMTVAMAAVSKQMSSWGLAGNMRVNMVLSLLLLLKIQLPQQLALAAVAQEPNCLLIRELVTAALVGKYSKYVGALTEQLCNNITAAGQMACSKVLYKHGTPVCNVDRQDYAGCMVGAVGAPMCSVTLADVMKMHMPGLYQGFLVAVGNYNVSGGVEACPIELWSEKWRSNSHTMAQVCSKVGLLACQMAVMSSYSDCNYAGPHEIGISYTLGNRKQFGPDLATSGLSSQCSVTQFNGQSIIVSYQLELMVKGVTV